MWTHTGQSISGHFLQIATKMSLTRKVQSNNPYHDMMHKIGRPIDKNADYIDHLFPEKLYNQNK